MFTAHSLMCMHVCVCANMYMCSWVVARRQPQVLLLRYYLTFFFSKDNPSLPWDSLSRLGYRLDNEPQELSCLQPPQRLRLQERSHLIVFKQGFRGSNSSPHICKASTLLSCLPRDRLRALCSPFIIDTCL